MNLYLEFVYSKQHLKKKKLKISNLPTCSSENNSISNKYFNLGSRSIHSRIFLFIEYPSMLHHTLCISKMNVIWMFMFHVLYIYLRTYTRSIQCVRYVIQSKLKFFRRIRLMEVEQIIIVKYR